MVECLGVFFYVDFDLGFDYFLGDFWFVLGEVDFYYC